VTRGRLPQIAGSPGLNGGGAAAAVTPYSWINRATIANIVQVIARSLREFTKFIWMNADKAPSGRQPSD